MSQHPALPPAPVQHGWVATANGWVPAPPDSKMVWSILVMVFAFLPFGIVAVMKSSEVTPKWAMGDYAGAQRAADDAGKWIKYSLIAGAIILGLMFLAFAAYLVIMIGFVLVLSGASGIYS